jgi:hypothetical protein
VKRKPGRPRHRWEVNIKIDLRKIGLGGMDGINLAQDGDEFPVLVNTGMNIRDP